MEDDPWVQTSRGFFSRLGLGVLLVNLMFPCTVRGNIRWFSRMVCTCTSSFVCLSDPTVGLVIYRTVCENIDRTYVVHVFLVFPRVRLEFLGMFPRHA